MRPVSPEARRVRALSFERHRSVWAERDRSWALWLNRAAARPWLVTLLAAVSRLGDGAIWYTLMAMLPGFGGPQGAPTAWRMFAVGLASLAIYKLLKHRIARPRPYVGCPGIRVCARSLDEFSFPSGHVMHAVAFSLLLSAAYPMWAWLAWSFTALVALSRVVLGLHYPSDVAIGAAIGLVAGELGRHLL